MANDLVPFFFPGKNVTYKATATVTGKRFLKVSGNRTGGPGLSTDLLNVYQFAPVSASGGIAVGVSDKDVASAALGGAFVAGVVPVTAGDTIAAGGLVQSDAAGKAIPLVSGGHGLGLCLNGAVADGDAEVLLLLSAAGEAADNAQAAPAALTFTAVSGTANDTLEAVPNPTDTPASADVLRDDLVATLLPPIRNNFADLATKVNEIRTALINAGIIA